jgi:predicted Zn-dependent peptidase
VWGADHPYARGVGSREVAAATQAEACAFVDRYYVPTRAILVVSGNLDPAVMQPRIGRRFGPIARVSDAPGPSLPPALRLRGTKSEHYADVERPTALIYLDAPSWGSDDQPLHDAMISAVGSALLDLDRREAWVVDTAIGYVGAGHRRATLVMVEVSDPARLADVTRAVLAAGTGILVDDDDDGDADDDNDPDDQDIVHQLASLRGRLQTSTITAADRPIGRGALLADYLTFTSHRDFALHDMRGNDAITGNRLRAYAAERFRAERVHVATVIPSGRGGTGRAAVALAGPTYDLSPAQLPVDPAAAATPLKLPPIEVPVTIERLRLDNGLRILLYAAPGSPTFEARMVFPAGRVDERRGERGVAALATDLLWHDFDRQYPARTVALVNWALRLGTAVDTSVGEEFTIFGVRGLAMFGDWHLWRLAWLLHQGVYREGDLATARQDLREAGDRETSPSGVAFRERLWGRRHPYALPPPSAEDLAELTRGQLAAWRDARFGVDGATLIVAGGFDPAAMRRHLGELFSPLPRGRAAARAALPDPVPTPGPSWIRHADPDRRSGGAVRELRRALGAPARSRGAPGAYRDARGSPARAARRAGRHLRRQRRLRRWGRRLDPRRLRRPRSGASAEGRGRGPGGDPLPARRPDRRGGCPPTSCGRGAAWSARPWRRRSIRPTSPTSSSGSCATAATSAPSGARPRPTRG